MIPCEKENPSNTQRPIHLFIIYDAIPVLFIIDSKTKLMFYFKYKNFNM